MSEVMTLALRAKEAATGLGTTSTEQRNRALLAMAHGLMANQDEIIAANQKDMEAAREKGVASALLDP